MERYLKEAVIPIVWYEELSQVDSDQVDNIKMLFVYPTKYEKFAIFILIGFGFVLLLMSLCCCCCCGKKKVSLSLIKHYFLSLL